METMPEKRRADERPTKRKKKQKQTKKTNEAFRALSLRRPLFPFVRFVTLKTPLAFFAAWLLCVGGLSPL